MSDYKSEQYITSVPDKNEVFKESITQFQEFQDIYSEYFEENNDVLDIAHQLKSYRNQEYQDYFEKKEKESAQNENTETEEKETEEEMCERKEVSFEPVEYVVRGAYIRCTCGSHCRRLNLPGNHENYKSGRPLVNAKDTIPGDKVSCTDDFQKHLINIPYFGVCESGSSPGEKIILVKDAERDPSGNVIKETEKMHWYTMGKTQNVKGPICIPLILTNWLNANQYVQVGDSYGVTTDSFAVCQYGGIIEILQSGQDMDDNIDEVEE